MYIIFFSRLRVIVLGPPESGKTSLVKCLTSDGKSPDVTAQKKEDDCKISLWFPFRDPQNGNYLISSLYGYGVVEFPHAFRALTVTQDVPWPFKNWKFCP